ncbi:MAG TPA: YraN family protein, partial [Candidatus Limnocylindrales bacterium]|nr:YraN family protein [Candidatus Limnocylindrales bacterium]
MATTLRQRRGADAEQLAVDYLLGLGWRVVGRNVKVGRDEVDVLALDTGPPRTLVNVEVRSLSVS